VCEISINITRLFAVTQPILDKDTFKNIKVIRAAGPHFVLNGIVKHCLKRALNSLTKILRAVFRIQCVPPAWEQPRVMPAGTGAQKGLSFYRFLNLLDTTGKVSSFMLTRSVSDLRSHGPLRDEQVEFRLTAGRQNAWTVPLQGLIETLKSSC